MPRIDISIENAVSNKKEKTKNDLVFYPEVCLLK